MTRQSTLRSSRGGRMAMLGGLATGMAGQIIADGTRQLVRGKKPLLSELVLSNGNARRISNTLSKMRGAAMKVGQLLSMDVGYLLPPEIAGLFANLRQDAHFMPMTEVAETLHRELGPDWQKQFKRFGFTPIAAASIGQVHEAELHNGQRVAVKIQYPGVAESIDSDIRNVQMILKMLNLIPEGVNIDDLIEDARLQLHDEADYRKEATLLDEFAVRLAEDDRFVVPDVLHELSGSKVLTMSFLSGGALENIRTASPQLRQQVGEALMALSLKEVFEWGLVQTDPNFANYFYDNDSGRIGLLDFGATRHYPPERQQQLHQLLAASLEQDHEKIKQTAIAVGYLAADDDLHYQQAIIQLLDTVTEPLRAYGEFDFKNNDLGEQMSEQLIELRVRQKFARIPPTDILFLHRKLGGLYLMLTHLGVSLDVSRLLMQSTGLQYQSVKTQGMD